MAQGNTVTLSLAGLGAILGVVATGWAAWNTQRLSERQHLDEYQLGVFTTVLSALETNDAARIAAVQSLVLTLPEDGNLPKGQSSLRDEMMVLLCTRANLAGEGQAVTRVCAELPSELAGEQGTQATQVAEAPRDALIETMAAPPPAPAPTTSTTTTPPARRAPASEAAPAPTQTEQEAQPPQQQQQARADYGNRRSQMTRAGALWSVDVFYCEGNASAEQRAQAAFQILSAEAQAPSADAGLTLGRIRVRPLPANVNSRSGYQVGRDELRAESSEREAAAALRALMTARNGPALDEAVSETPTPFYLSAFYCG